MGASAFLRPRQVAELLGVTERSIRRWIADDTIPSVKVGGARLVPLDGLEQLLRSALDLPEEEGSDEM